MKTSTSILLGMGLIAAIASQPGWAAKDDGPKKKEAGVSESKEKPSGKKLDLNEEQRKTLQETRKAHREAVQPLREKLRSEMRALREQVREGKGDAEIGAGLDRIKGLKSSIQKEREQFEAKLASILKPTQRAKLLFAAHRRGLASRGGFGRGDGRGEKRGGGRKGRGGQRDCGREDCFWPEPD